MWIGMGEPSAYNIFVVATAIVARRHFDRYHILNCAHHSYVHHSIVELMKMMMMMMAKSIKCTVHTRMSLLHRNTQQNFNVDIQIEQA